MPKTQMLQNNRCHRYAILSNYSDIGINLPNLKI